ncbi:hypothetical protein [Staphylococcus phage vB_SsapH-Golestan-100]|nr:hypothetical protein [Staphylococcus phage vB_SsapH-Golestan-100]
MKQDIAKRAFDNSVEYLYEKGWLHFPKKLNTDSEFKVKSYKDGVLSFEVRKGSTVVDSYISFIAWDFIYDFYLKNEDVNMNYAMAIFIRYMCKEMYNRI